MKISTETGKNSPARHDERSSYIYSGYQCGCPRSQDGRHNYVTGALSF